MGGGAKGPWLTFADYIPIGFEHIVPKGLDHILFVLGLFLFDTRLRQLSLQISAFTAAHTVTLAAAATNVISIPSALVEPAIAISIIYIAVENILAKGASPLRLPVVFLFGLLHGLGFASVLAEFGLPERNFLPALLGFNLGVEIGQLTVVAAAFGLIGLWFNRHRLYRTLVVIPGSAFIGLAGTVWLVQRVT
jgi:hydrogenase/urease accessory protein HupE